MSLKNQITQNCPHCQSLQELYYYNSVNVTLDSSLKERVLQGKLNSQNCSNCGEEINIVGDFLYHDMEHKLMIHFKEHLDSKELENFEMVKDLKDKGYIYRHVTSYPELIEKIKIFDLQLNDLVIASVKLTVYAMLKDSLEEVVDDIQEVEIPVFFETIEKGLFKKKLVFVFALDPSQMMVIKHDVKKLSKPERKLLFEVDVLRKQGT